MSAVAATRRLEGIAASGGVVVGPPVLVGRRDEQPDGGALVPLDEAVATVVDHYTRLAAAAREQGRDEEADILEAYELMVDDPSLHAAVAEVASEQDVPLDEAVRMGGQEIVDELAALEDAYMAQRAEDLQAALGDLVAAVRGQDLDRSVELPQGAVLVADELTPADTSQLDLARVGGFAIARGGRTSHTAIIARTHGLPAVVGAAGIVAAAQGAAAVLVDGESGVVVVEPDEQERTAARQRGEQRDARRQAARRLHGTAVSFDSVRVLVAANVGDPEQLAVAVDAAADGVGLYRTEFLHLGDDEPPSREQQAAAYTQAVAAFDDPVIVRTIDIGGDKQCRWLEMPHEENPFLGVRGLRLALANPEVMITQLDALLDVDAPGLQVMLPMVAALDDLRRARQVWDGCVARAGREPPPLGIMVETPAAALLAHHLVREVDFVSIGTNDLTQYTTAADRGEAALRAYHDPVAPPVLRLVAMTAQAAHAAGVPVGVCGAAASDAIAAVLLLGMGVHELSVPPTDVDEVRALVDALDPATARRLASEALDLPDAHAVRELVTDAIPALA